MSETKKKPVAKRKISQGLGPPKSCVRNPKLSNSSFLNESTRINSGFLREMLKRVEEARDGKATPNKAPLKCFKNHVFFLSVTRKCLSNEKRIKEDIERLGGRLESFFGQEVTCVITDELVWPEMPDSESNNGGGGKMSGGSSSLLISARSRNLSALAAIPSGKKSSPKSSVVNVFNKAKLWGQAIWKLNNFLAFLKMICCQIKSPSKSASKSKAGFPSRAGTVGRGVMSDKTTPVTYLKKYFVKVESVKRNKCPIYKNLPSYPNIRVCTQTRNGSPFNDKELGKETPAALSSAAKPKTTKEGKNTTLLHSSSPQIESIKNNNKVFGAAKQVGGPRKAGGVARRFYCQCCNTNFSSYERHTNGPRHQAFIRKKENLQCIYDVIEQFGIVSELERHSGGDPLSSQSDESSASNGFASDESLTSFTNEIRRQKPCKVLSSLGSDQVGSPVRVQNAPETQLKNHSSNSTLEFESNRNLDQSGPVLNYNDLKSNLGQNLTFDVASALKREPILAEYVQEQNLMDKKPGALKFESVQLDDPNLSHDVGSASNFDSSLTKNLLSPDFPQNWSQFALKFNSSFAQKSNEESSNFAQKTVEESSNFAQKTVEESSNFAQKSVEESSNFAQKTVEESSNFAQKSVEESSNFALDNVAQNFENSNFVHETFVQSPNASVLVQNPSAWPVGQNLNSFSKGENAEPLEPQQSPPPVDEFSNILDQFLNANDSGDCAKVEQMLDILRNSTRNANNNPNLLEQSGPLPNFVANYLPEGNSEQTLPAPFKFEDNSFGSEDSSDSFSRANISNFVNRVLESPDLISGRGNETGGATLNKLGSF